jgi:hypothetical protein
VPVTGSDLRAAADAVLAASLHRRRRGQVWAATSSGRPATSRLYYKTRISVSVMEGADAQHPPSGPGPTPPPRPNRVTTGSDSGDASFQSQTPVMTRLKVAEIRSILIGQTVS